MKKIHWGIIGCGDVTELKSGPAFSKVDGSDLHMVMRRDLLLVQDYAQRHNVPEWTVNADDLINNKKVNAIYVATPPGVHADYAIKAMKAGKPVYVEKPMAATYQQCKEMIKVSEETGVPLFVAYYRRTLPGFLKVKELIDGGEIGKPLYVNIRLTRPALNIELQGGDSFWRLDKDKAGGGIFFDLASHQLDFMDYLFGPIVEATGLTANRGGYYTVEDTVSASFRFENGVLGNGLWSFVTNDHVDEDMMEIVGVEGKIVFSGFQHHPIILYKSGEEIEYPYLNPENIQYNLIKQVVEQLQGKGQCVSTGITAARTNKIMQLITGQ
nr:Gfo/Idh/MocA family oxidoreductase [uncultured Carboxylicivirga sp.]